MAFGELVPTLSALQLFEYIALLITFALGTRLHVIASSRTELANNSRKQSDGMSIVLSVAVF